MQSGFTMLANFIGNVFHSPTAAVKILFLQMAQYCVNRVVEMAKSIEGIINKIPGVQVDFTSGLGNLQAGLEAKISSIKDESGWTEYIKEPQKAGLWRNGSQRIYCRIRSGRQGISFVYRCNSKHGRNKY